MTAFHFCSLVSASMFNEVADEDFLEKPSDMKMFTSNQEADSGKEKKKSTSDGKKIILIAFSPKQALNLLCKLAVRNT